jgi:hypothetical protein
MYRTCNWGSPPGLFGLKTQYDFIQGLNLNDQGLGCHARAAAFGKDWCGTGRNWIVTSEAFVFNRLPVLRQKGTSCQRQLSTNSSIAANVSAGEWCATPGSDQSAGTF